MIPIYSTTVLYDNTIPLWLVKYKVLTSIGKGKEESFYDVKTEEGCSIQEEAIF